MKPFSKIQKTLIIVGGASIVLLIGYLITKKMKVTNNGSKKSVLLLGGLDTRAGDKKINEQVELMKSGFSKDVNINGFRYFDKDGIIKQIEKDKNSFVVLFSAGCGYAETIAKKIIDVGGNLSNMYILEPYAVSQNTATSVQNAVKLGVPAKNVFVGSWKGTGLGVVSGATPTPNCSPSHWCSLVEVSKKISNLV